ncbi:hypothetical protein BGZ70_003399 [Mortierella alpina]|uniref:Uncharacterized protein n=1 Tax=Mortierella alpina TaxID=64518 RepID=A0A9P6M594_MORAP|nr:hypothetical protein BGZ70_003399 [Mortierella alpina]
MATTHHTVYATSSPAIIDLRQSSAGAKAKDKTKHGLLDAQKSVKNNPQDVYPSPPSGASEDEHNDVDVELALSIEDTEISDGEDSDTMDGTTDATSLADGESSGSSFMDQDVEEEAASSFDLPRMILQGLCPTVQGAPKTIPTMVLYDDRGLQLFDEITYLDEYYLTQEEIEILERDGDKIVENIPDNSVVVELGAGSLRKTVLLLNALERKRKNIRYYALDLMLDELTKSLKSLGHFANVKTAGLWGTYDEGLAFVSSFGPEVPKTLLWLGSSIGNLNRVEAKDFIASYRKTLNVGDNWLIGIDRRNDAQEITVAYNDPKGITRDFVMNGLTHINVILGQDFIDREKFQYFAQYNVEAGRHEAYYQVKETHELVYRVSDNHTKGREEDEIRIQLQKDELINVEYSYKWSPVETASLFEQTEMTKVGQWTSASNRYDLHLVRKTPFYFKPSSDSDTTVCPSQDEWTELWKSWDVLSRCLKEPFSEPAYFNDIFERGIDPDVDDPTKCHSHSAVPETWPSIESIIDFRDRVRERLFRVLDDSVTYPMNRRLARVLFMAFEHEAMHLETLLYMLVQSPNTLPPPSVPAPWDFKSKMKDLALTSAPASMSTPPAATWISIDPSQLDSSLLSLGHNDSEAKDCAEDKRHDLKAAFGWDNEHPLVTPTQVPSSFKIQSRQVTNSEFFAFMQSSAKLNEASMIPASWQMEGHGASPQEVSVKTVYGPVPLTLSGEWPVSCSNVQATAYAAWYSSQHGSSGTSGKKSEFALPTEHELSIAFKLKQATVPKTGMENYGFRRWYPTTDDQVRGALTSSSSSSAEEAMQAFSGPGGLWDWTSTPFAPLVTDGFETSQLYPGYSSDFFDGKHLVVLGASWATHPRIAERRSFRNWYQVNYPFVFAGFRLVERC